jgi:hypothetical protein
MARHDLDSREEGRNVSPIVKRLLLIAALIVFVSGFVVARLAFPIRLVAVPCDCPDPASRLGDIADRLTVIGAGSMLALALVLLAVGSERRRRL